MGRKTVAVPIETVAILAARSRRLISRATISPPRRPIWRSGTPLAADETIRIAVTRR